MRIKGVFRIAPVLLPQCVTRTTGNPVSRSVVPLVPPLLSYSSTCSRTQSRGLGTYLAMGLDLRVSVGSLPPRSLCARYKCRPAHPGQLLPAVEDRFSLLDERLHGLLVILRCVRPKHPLS